MRLIIILILLFAYKLNAQEIWTLEKCIKHALENNITVKQSKLDVNISEKNKRTAIGNFFPSLNIGASHSWNSGLNQNITTGILENLTTQSASLNSNMNIDIFNGLQNIQQLYRSNLAILASEYQLENIKEEISLLVANAYLQILFNKETLSINRSQLKVAKEEFLIAKEQFNTGIIPEGDVLEIEANLSANEQEVVIIENNYILSKFALAQLLLITDISNFEIADENYFIPDSKILELDINTIYNLALKKRKNIKLAETNLSIAKKDLAISKANLYPKLSGFYSYNSRVLFNSSESIKNQLDLNAGENFGIQITIPVFNNMTNNVNIELNKINIYKNQYNLNQTKLELENTINQAYYDVIGSLKAFEAAEKTLKASKLAYNYAKESYSNGVINTFNLMQANTRFKNAQATLIKNKYDYIFKLKVLEFYCGTENAF